MNIKKNKKVKKKENKKIQFYNNNKKISIINKMIFNQKIK
jgi:hypothetical protein